MSKLSAPLFVASDIHLLSCHDDKGQMLLQVIDQVAKGEVEHLVLLGDIFDFCLGNHPFFQKRFAALGAALQKVSESGTEVTYIEGNHEFRTKNLDWPGVNFVPDGDTHIKLSSGESFKMAHGDMIYSHNRYKRFRSVVKSRWFTGLARWVPGSLLNYLATGSAQISRAQDEYRTIDHHEILKAANQWLSQCTSDYGLFGHFHVPYAEERWDGKAGGLYSLDSWYKPNFLVFKDGQFGRWFIKSPIKFELESPVAQYQR